MKNINHWEPINRNDEAWNMDLTGTDYTETSRRCATYYDFDDEDVTGDGKERRGGFVCPLYSTTKAPANHTLELRTVKPCT